MFSGGFVLISFYCMYCVAIEYFCSYYFIVICVVAMKSLLLLMQTQLRLLILSMGPKYQWEKSIQTTENGPYNSTSR